MNKKAQTGTTLTWFVAVIALFFILLIFLIFFGALNAAREKNSISLSESSHMNYESFRGLVGFLESDYEGQTVSDYLSSTNFDWKRVDQDLRDNLPRDDCYNYFLILDDVTLLRFIEGADYALKVSSVNPDNGRDEVNYFKFLLGKKIIKFYGRYRC